MLFHSSLRRELARSFGATCVTLLIVVMTMMLVRTLGQASKGQVNPSEILLVMGYTVMGHLPTILTLSLFIASVASISRLYRDSEMVIWLGSGRGLAEFLSPMFRFAWPVLLVIQVLALWGWPWANQQIQELSQRYEQRSDLDRVTPGQFQESAGGNRVFFIERNEAQPGTAKNVLISQRDGQRESITTAQHGEIDKLGNDRFLILKGGQRWDLSQDQNTVSISQFEQYGVRIRSNNSALDQQPSDKTKSSWSLLQDPKLNHLGELAWRLGLGFAAANLVLLALAISAGNPRVGRSGHLMLALFSFVIYYNLINLGQSWITSGRQGFWEQMLGLHGSAALLAAAWLAKRHFNWQLPRLKRRRREA